MKNKLNKFVAYEKAREDACAEGYEDYTIECEICGELSPKMFCSKRCYLIGKADHDIQQAKDDRATGDRW